MSYFCRENPNRNDQTNALPIRSGHSGYGGSLPCGGFRLASERNRTNLLERFRGAQGPLCRAGERRPEPRADIFLAGHKYRDIGMNCYDLFNCALKFTDDGLRIDLSDSFATLELLKKEGIGLIRFNCGIYYSAELGASYMTDRDAYIDALRQIAARAQELETGLIPMPDVALCRRAGIFRRAVPQLGAGRAAKRQSS